MEAMSITAIRTAKIQPLRPTQESSEKSPAAAPSSSSQSALARAVSLHLAGKPAEALQQLQSAVAANEASPEIYRAMGHIQFEQGAFNDAGKSYRTLTQMKPQYAKGWFNLAVCMERLNNWDEASQAFHRACT